GRLAIEKNYPMLLRVASRFRPEEQVRFFIVGPGELEASLKRRAHAMGLDDRVQFLGLRRDIPALLRAADLFAFTSRSEGAPNALLEAMAAGLPIVTTRFAGFGDIVAGGQNAAVIDHDDDVGFETAIRMLLADGEVARKLADQARRTVEERFSVPAMVEATLRFYRRILDAAD
ncbi:MAG TPA: glycosyltransferase family 4 protein, partial [Candidatus Polarisedimenticolia bacterium]|nr:glycosyltransferase family 4 protein [Candidatus Polarisedimenticolia bacterium]